MNAGMDGALMTPKLAAQKPFPNPSISYAPPPPTHWLKSASFRVPHRPEKKETIAGEKR